MPTTRFTDLVGCEKPLQLAGMGAIGSDVALPAAVSNAGGLGMLGVAGMPAPQLAGLLDAMANATKGPFGTNFLMPFVDTEAVAVAAKRCRVVEFFYGDPDPSLIGIVHDGGALACWQVGSKAEADAAVHAGVDVLVVQGTGAGGHVRGKQSLADVLAETVGLYRVPLLAAGGIGAAADVRAALEAGADGVRIGTRFLAADESIAHSEYVAALIQAASADTVLTQTFSLGWPNAPHRVLRTSVEAATAISEDTVAVLGEGAEAWPVPRLSSMPPVKGVSGNVAAMAMYAGTSVDAVTKRQPAREIVAELCSGI
jgi:NAD(P)H-dependent flavin oxidoreductase YrpB (nitropropane dioxygenase family)